MEVSVPPETIAEIGIPRQNLQADIIECNGKTVWKAGKSVGIIQEIEKVFSNKDYVKFRVKPGEYVFIRTREDRFDNKFLGR